MAYQKQTFNDGKTLLCDDHLWHIEDGIINVEKQAIAAQSTADNANTAASEAKTIAETIAADYVTSKQLHDEVIKNLTQSDETQNAILEVVNSSPKTFDGGEI